MPFLTWSGPASYCGFISTTASAAGRASASAAGSTSLSGMKLTSTVTRSGGSASRDGSSLRMSVASIDDHVGAPAKTRMQLVTPDVDRVDAAGAACEQHLREAAGGRADVEADAAGRFDAEMIERGRELDAAARHPGMRRQRPAMRRPRIPHRRAWSRRRRRPSPGPRQWPPAPWRGSRTGRARPATGQCACVLSLFLIPSHAHDGEANG